MFASLFSSALARLTPREEDAVLTAPVLDAQGVVTGEVSAGYRTVQVRPNVVRIVGGGADERRFIPLPPEEGKARPRARPFLDISTLRQRLEAHAAEQRRRKALRDTVQKRNGVRLTKSEKKAARKARTASRVETQEFLNGVRKDLGLSQRGES